MDSAALKTVRGGTGLVNVGDSAFRNCAALTAFTLESKVKTIGKSAFMNCAALKTVKGGAGLVTVGDSAFRGCTALTGFSFGKKVSTIGKTAFYGCKKLKAVDILTKKLTARTVGANAFKGIYSRAVVRCPASKLKAYKKLLLQRGMGSKVKFIGVK